MCMYTLIGTTIYIMFCGSDNCFMVHIITFYGFMLYDLHFVAKWFVCACIHVKKNGVVKEAIVRHQTWKKMGWCTAKWKMLLFCAKTIVKGSRKFELDRLKKKNILAEWGGLSIRLTWGEWGGLSVRLSGCVCSCCSITANSRSKLDDPVSSSPVVVRG